MLFLECSGDCKVSVTLQTQVARPQLAAAWGRNWTEQNRKQEHQLVARGHTLLTKSEKTPGWVTLDHRSDPLQVAAAALGVEAPTRDNISPDLFDKPA